MYMTAVERVNKLSQKISQIQAGPMSLRKLQSIDQFDSKMYELEGSILHFKDSMGQDCDFLNNTLAKLQSQIETQRRARQGSSQSHWTVCQPIDEICQEEVKNRKDNQLKHNKVVDDKFNKLQKDLSVEVKQRNQAFKKISSHLLKNVPQLTEKNRINSLDRNEADEMVVKWAKEELTNLNSEIDTSKQDRAQTEQEVIQMLKGLSEKMSQQLACLKKERQDSQSRLLQRLQTTVDILK